ncbi:transglutaminase TgpA family protein [Thermomonas alba]|uniref:transglutaminase TgpA family protein n=1 Tax=Thermomonas alba TaxID=2888525 RepID=UPI001F0363A7|nr:transglutaminaseTgpA domain-containing protein [Thermomonas alba]
MPEAATTPRMPPATLLQVRLAAAVCLLPLLLQLPLALGLGFGIGTVAVLAASWRQPLPAPIRWLLGGTALLAVAAVLPGVGRDTACALLAAMLALKPAETFTPRDGRSLVGFALFAPFATFLLDQGPLSLLLGLAGVLLALLALQQLAADEGGVPPSPLRQAAAGVLRLLGLGLPLALAAFWLFPRLPTPLWGLPQRNAAVPGLSDTMTPGSFFDLLLDDSPAARVEFIGPAPQPSQMYWRGPVLWDFDGRTWHQARDLLAQPPAPVQVSGPVWDYRIDLEPTEDRQLVALDVPLQLPQGARLGHDLTPQAEAPQYNVSRWRMRSAAAAAFEPVLPPALRARALALPTGYNPRTLALGRQWRREAGHDAQGRTDAAIAERALAMIRRDFAYTLNVPPARRDEVDDFLFDRRTGYCEHFSSAFVVLMRAAGVPARVVTGYAGAYRNPVGGYWLVRKSDAHAWAEVWLPGRGWVRVDPTAAVAPERVYDTLADRRPGRIAGFDGLAPMFDAADWLRRGWNDFVLGFNAQRQQALLKPLGLQKLGAAGLAALFAACALLALAWMIWRTTRGERTRDPLLRAWHALETRYRRRGLGRAPHEPAQTWAARVGADVPHAGAPLAELARRFADARYGAPTTPAALRALLRDLRRHRP